MGQPLDVGFDVRVDAAENAIAQCFRAEVLHGDHAIDPGRVRILVQALSSSPTDIVVRVRSNAAVDEPVVGVVLHSQCGAAQVRRYDFLADFPVEMPVAQISASDTASLPASGLAAVPATPPAPVPAAAPAPAAPNVTPPPRAADPAPAPVPVVRAPAPAPSAAAARPAQRRPAKRPVQALPAAKRDAAAAPAKAAPTRSAGAGSAGRPRLTLDTPPASASMGLRGTRELAAPPSENLPQRAEAAAAWRALNAAPEDAQREGQRLLALEQQEKQAREAREKSERELRARLERAERRLDEAESSRIDIAIVYGLIALLLLAIAAAAYFWNRARKSALEAAHWARGSDTLEAAAAVAAEPRAEPLSSQPASKASMTAELESPGAAAGGVRSAGAALAAAGVATFPVATGAAQKKPAEPAAPRELNPEEFFDVQQHADFFVSLGQYDQAIDVLRKHIAEYGASSPLAFLELLTLYHTLSRPSDYNALRDEFQQLFNVHVPNFAAFSDEGLSLEDYPATVLSIETAWGHPRVLDTIEANLVRTPGDTGKPFDLAAFRDLLMLYAVARIAQDKNGDALAPTDSGRSGLRALEEDSNLLPRRSARPDFSASLTPSDPRHATFSGAAAASAGALAAGAAAARAGAPEPSTGGLELELDSIPAPLLSSPPQYDNGLDLDLSNSQLHDLGLADERDDDIHPTLPAVSEVDIDLPLLDMDGPAAGEPVPAAAKDEPSPKPAVDSGMIDFDLFDPNTEAQIAPKSTR